MKEIEAPDWETLGDLTKPMSAADFRHQCGGELHAYCVMRRFCKNNVSVDMVRLFCEKRIKRLMDDITAYDNKRTDDATT